MRHGSVFSGIGGFDLAASWMGWENVFQCEKDPFCRRVLNYYWPTTVCYEEIRAFDATSYRGIISVLSGGFPCQPFSLAGRRRGTADDRYLWPEMLRVIREIRPRWVVAENVFGLVNWRRGLVFEQVQADLESCGYEVWSYLLPAAAVGAPHRRDRVWVVARFAGGDTEYSSHQLYGAGGGNGQANEYHEDATTANPDSSGCEGSGYAAEGSKQKNVGKFPTQYVGNPWKNFPSESPLCVGNDGLSRRLDGITFPGWRTGALRAAGNAIVPQVALQIFRTIDVMEKEGM